MDIATLIGIILGLGAIVGSIFLMTPDFGMFGSASSFGIVFGGMLASVAVLIGGLLMKFYQVFWVDSLLTAIIALYLIFVGWDLLRDSFKLLMLFTPTEIPLKTIASKVCEIEEVKNMHHIHVWQLNENEVHLEAHVDFNKDITLSEFDEILIKIEKEIHAYGINHINIQPEFNKPDNKSIIVQD